MEATDGVDRQGMAVAKVDPGVAICIEESLL